MIEKNRSVRSTKDDEPRLPRLSGGFLLAANVAQDMERRISAHAIFSVVGASELPFRFPATFYAIIQFLDLTPGTHTIGLVGSEGLVFDVSEQTVTIASDGRDFLIVVVPIVGCVLERFGDVTFYVTVDGQRLPDGTTLRVLQTSTGNDES